MVRSLADRTFQLSAGRLRRRRVGGFRGGRPGGLRRLEHGVAGRGHRGVAEAREEGRAAPELRRVVAAEDLDGDVRERRLANFGKMLLVFGCIKTKFCK